MPSIPIPQYQRQIAPQGSANAGNLDAGGMDIARGLSGVGEGLNDLGRSQAYREDANFQKQQRDDLVAADTAFATFQARMDTQLKERMLNAPLDAKNFTGDSLKSFDDSAEELTKGIKDPRIRDLIKGRSLVVRERVAGDSTLFEATQGIKNRTAEVVTAREQREVLVRSKPGEFETQLAQTAAVIESAGLPPNVAREQLDISKERLAAASVSTLVEADPRGTLAALSSPPGESGNAAIEALSPDGRDRARNNAEIEVRRREAEAKARATEARLLAAAQAGALKDYMADAHEQFSMGYGLPEGYADARQAIKSLPDSEIRKGELLRKDAVLSTLDNSGFLALSPKAQETAITSLSTEIRDSGASPASLDMLKLAQSIQSETSRLAKADPFKFALDRGAVKLPKGTGDAAADMKARAEAGRKASVFLGEDVPGFTGQELANLGESYSKGSVDERMSILSAITDSHGQKQASTVFEALDKQGKAGMGLAGALMLDDPVSARLVVKGQAVTKEGGEAGKALLPQKADRDLTDVLGDAYGLGTPARAAVEDGIWSAYVALSAEEGDASGNLDPDRLEQATDAVTGGLIQYMGRTMPTPKRGVTQGQFSRWAGALEPSDFSSVAGLDANRAYQAFRADGWLEPIGQNKYAPMIMGPDGRGRFLVDGKGNPVSLSYDGGRQKDTASLIAETPTLSPFGPLTP